MSKARVVVLGSNGMLGHVLSQVLSEDPELEVIRANRSPYPGEIFFDGSRPTFLDAEPDYVVNCIGLLVNDSEKNPELAAWTNGHLPYMIAAACAKEKAKLIHISTDCVFKGDRGKYTVDDKPDATSIYGQTKALGEITNSPNHLTIRTSIIGPEIKMKGSGLFHWFMTQDKEVNGWSNVFWNGVTTLRLARSSETILSMAPVVLSTYRVRMCRNIFFLASLGVSGTVPPISLKRRIPLVIKLLWRRKDFIKENYFRNLRNCMNSW